MIIPNDAELATLVKVSAELMSDQSVSVPLRLQAEGLRIVDSRIPTVLEVEVSSAAPEIPAGDGAVPEMMIVSKDGAPVGLLMFWVKRGRLDGVEFSWLFEVRPDRWPHPGELARTEG